MPAGRPPSSERVSVRRAVRGERCRDEVPAASERVDRPRREPEPRPGWASGVSSGRFERRGEDDPSGGCEGFEGFEDFEDFEGFEGSADSSWWR